VEVKRNEDVEYPRKYGDYTVAVHRDQIPETVEVSEKI
jgi:CRISPR-associated protein Csd2